MKHVKTYEKIKTFADFLWLKGCIKDHLGDFQFYAKIFEGEKKLALTVYYNKENVSTWEGLKASDLDKILKFYNYLISSQIISDESQFSFISRGQFSLEIIIDVDVLENNSELGVYRDVNKYNL